MNYKIIGLFYTKPRIVLDGNLEPVASRLAVSIRVGILFELMAGYGMRKVSRIKFAEEEKQFYVYFDECNRQFPRKALLTIPLLADTEVFYEEVSEVK